MQLLILTDSRGFTTAIHDAVDRGAAISMEDERVGLIRPVTVVVWANRDHKHGPVPGWIREGEFTW